MMLLNLTSPDIHQTLKLRAQTAVARTVVTVLLGCAAAFIASAVVGGSLLEQRVTREEQAAERSTLLLTTQGQASISETTKKLNAQVAELLKIQKRYVQWGPTISAFAALTPDGITIQSIHISQTTGTLTFEAVAKTREAYVNYEKVLQASSQYRNVEFVLQTKRSDISFSYGLTLANLPAL